MPRYIDADALIYDLLSYAEANKGTYHEDGFRNAVTVVEDQPTANVVPVVRCKNCKFYNEDEMMCNDTNGFDRYWKPTDFCSYGKRRTNDDRA